MTDPYAKLTSAAHSGAFGLGAKSTPTAEQVRAGNYAKGSVRLHGLAITIETPMFTPRTGKEDGKPWSIVCMANYGYINGYKGADGDAFDVYVGPVPESSLVVVVNQVTKDRAFDEHKAVLGFYDVDSAMTAYRNSYERGWQGAGSYVTCTIKQFKAWLKSGDLTRPLEPADLIPDEVEPMNGVVVSWGADNLPVGQTLGDVIYGLRRADPDKLMLDSATMADITEYLSDGADGAMLDAMVIQYAQFERKANQLLRVMQAAAATVKVESVEVSQPFKNRGTTQVAMLFSMSDGQSVSVFFHNPDSTPNRLTAKDELISWKWVLNKKDITVVVAPERGQDISPRQVARRIMTLVEKNSAKFIKATGASADKVAQLDELKTQVQSKTAELQSLDEQIADLQAKVAAQPAPIATPAAVPQKPAAEGNQAPLQIDRTTWDQSVTQALADLLEVGYGDAAGVVEAQQALADAQYLAVATPADAAQAINAASSGGGQQDLPGAAPAQQASGDDLVKLTDALKAGNAMAALGVLDAITDVDVLRQVVQSAGFNPGTGNTKDEILASVGKDLVRAAKAKVDGHGLSVPNKPAPGADDFNEAYPAWEDAVAMALAALLSVDQDAAKGMVHAQDNLVSQLYVGEKSPQEAAQVLADAALAAPPPVDAGADLSVPGVPPPPPEDDKDSALNTAKAYLDSVIDGSVDMSDPDSVMKELERIYAAFGEGELSGLFSDAAEAFSQHALKATAEVF